MDRAGIVNPVDPHPRITRPGDKDREHSYYRCPHCHGWHLTSKRGRKRA